MAECSLFALVPTRCAADVEVGTSKASDGVFLASVYTRQTRSSVGDTVLAVMDLLVDWSTWGGALPGQELPTA